MSRMYKNVNHNGCNERLSESEMCYAREGDHCDDDNQQTAPYVVFINESRSQILKYFL